MAANLLLAWSNYWWLPIGLLVIVIVLFIVRSKQR
jgi:hypothetical protein